MLLLEGVQNTGLPDSVTTSEGNVAISRVLYGFFEVPHVDAVMLFVELGTERSKRDAAFLGPLLL